MWRSRRSAGDLLALLTAAALVHALPASADEEANSAGAAVTAHRALSASHQAMVSRISAAVVQSIARARAEIARGNASGARYELGKARKLLQAIRDTSPAARIGDQIAAAREALRAGAASDPGLVSIYEQLDSYERVATDKQTRVLIDQARNQIAAGDPDGAEETLETASGGLVYLEIDIPLAQTDAKLTRALAAIDESDLAAAGADLAAAQQHLTPIAD